MWGVVIVAEHAIYRKIVFYGKWRTRERGHGDDNRVTNATNDDLVILHEHELVNLVSNESM